MAFLSERSGVTEIRVINVAKGSVETLTSLREGHHFVESMSWFPDGSGLIFSVRTLFGFRAQVWFAAYPSGVLRRVTNDLGSYESVRMSPDGKSFTAIKDTDSTGFYVWDSDRRGDPSLIETIKNPVFSGWSDSHNVLFNNSSLELGAANLDTGQVKMLAADQRHIFWQPCSCGKDTVVFSGGLQGSSNLGIWKTDLRSGTFEQITHGVVDLFPACSKDGNEIFYADFSDSSKLRVMHVPIAGGTPQAIPDLNAVWFDLSPAGDQMICVFPHQANGKTEWEIRFISANTWQQIKSVPLGDASMDPVVRLTPDGKSVTFLVSDHGVENIWEKPLDGGPARQLTHFTDMRIIEFHWSPDGKKLGMVREAHSTDTVLFTDAAK
jgi:Tol biopolymer transport system component